MKILHMHTKMVSGGIESMVCSLVNELVKNHDVTLCTIFKPSIEDVFYNLLSPNVKKITLCKQKFGFSIKEIFGVYSVIKKGRYDIVHIHGCFQYYFLAILLLHKRVKFVYTIHSDAKMENQLWDTRLFALKKYYFKNRFIVPVTISRASQNSFVDLYDCGSSLIFNGTSTPKIDNSIKLLDQYRLTQNTKIFINDNRF